MGVHRRRVREAETVVDRPAQMIEAAAAVLAREGYENTSMKEIAAEAGVSSGLLHYYFGTKEELLAAVVRRLHDQMVADWHATVADVEDPLERLRRGMTAAARKFDEKPEFWQLLFDMYAVGLKNEVIRDRLREMVVEIIGQFAEEVRRINASLPVAAPVEPEDVAAATLAAIDGVALISSISGRSGAGSYRALLAMMASFLGMSYVMAGQEPPIERMLEVFDSGLS